MKNYKSFAEALNYFFNDYLTIQKNLSNHTIKSYKTTFRMFVKYLIDYKNIKIEKISFADINRKNVIDFLKHMETEYKISIKTRNQRLAAIKSFCRYVSHEPIEYLNNISQILEIASKGDDNKVVVIDYLTKEELTTYLNVISTNNRKGIRDYTLINLMYDSAARVEEMTNIKVNDLNLGNNPSVMLYGKGKKYRTVPICNSTRDLLIKYIELFKLNNFEYLFMGNKHSKCSTKMISHIVDKYAEISKINKNIHPHVFRHTRAMHMIEADIPLVYIRDILGHKEISTTEIYAKVNVETKRKALENVYNINNNFNNETTSWNKNEELIKSLLELD